MSQVPGVCGSTQSDNAGPDWPAPSEGYAPSDRTTISPRGVSGPVGVGCDLSKYAGQREPPGSVVCSHPCGEPYGERRPKVYNYWLWTICTVARNGRPPLVR
ncbi:hypothetical protein CBM2592_A140005 [Cupriavidus taiwanensis]|nr:hypothetical protein CBM2588_A110116 [Cupriavidus taiwanensis]SOY45304.1 hypothetical protein CBM2592_A140005 [Cupriavidus taiwanensis]SOY80697.1 hypothetical protein CBM2591_A170076 [Cupriavidus taiwanensis]SOZ52482.1 hypothetical protein CBM2617_A150078 [Cupriavidus taiwanensis]SOZ77056.1 hypothetical protein CBM2622_A140116 [Cupriavidus taiwanensis]